MPFLGVFFMNVYGLSGCVNFYNSKLDVWQDLKYCSQCKIFEVCLIIFQQYAWKSLKKGHGVTEAVARRCFIRKLFLKISQNSQENICARDSFFNKVAGLRTPPVAASGIKNCTLAAIICYYHI